MSPKKGVNELLAAAYSNPLVKSDLINGRAGDALARAREVTEYNLNINESELNALSKIKARDLNEFQKVCSQIRLSGVDTGRK